MNSEETLPIESEADSSVPETEESSDESTSSETIETTTVAYEETIQYDLNYNFGFMSIWLGAIFGALAILCFFKGFK